MARTLKSPLFGSRVPFGRAREFEATLPHPERTAYEIVGPDGDNTYREYPSRRAMLDAIHRAEQRSAGRGTIRELVKCPHGVHLHC